MTKKCNNANGKLQAIRHSVQGSTRALCGGQLSLQCTMKHPGSRFSFWKTSHAPYAQSAANTGLFSSCNRTSFSGWGSANCRFATAYLHANLLDDRRAHANHRDPYRYECGDHAADEDVSFTCRLAIAPVVRQPGAKRWRHDRRAPYSKQQHAQDN